MSIVRLFLCLLLFVAPHINAAGERNGMSFTRLSKLDSFMQTATGPQGYLGGVTLVARKGKVVQWQAYGHSDLARSKVLRKDAIFRIYSMSKTITSVAVLMLMEDGKLGLEDPIALHLPEFAALQLVAKNTTLQSGALLQPLTIRQLLTHTAGFATGGKSPQAARELLAGAKLDEARTLQEFTSRLAHVPLGNEPGQVFAYDGTNTEVLGRLVEVVSGRSFDRFLHERVFIPLRMPDTGFDVPTAQRSRIIDLTHMGDSGHLVLHQSPSAQTPGARLTPYLSGAGGLYSTAADYFRFCQMLLNGGTLDGVSILGRKTVELMMANHLTHLTPPSTSFGVYQGFGLGGSVLIDVAQGGRNGSLGAFGWSGAASTYYLVDRQEEMIALLLLQHLPRDEGPELPKISTRFYNLVYQAVSP